MLHCLTHGDYETADSAALLVIKMIGDDTLENKNLTLTNGIHGMC